MVFYLYTDCPASIFAVAYERDISRHVDCFEGLKITFLVSWQFTNWQTTQQNNSRIESILFYNVTYTLYHKSLTLVVAINIEDTRIVVHLYSTCPQRMLLVSCSYSSFYVDLLIAHNQELEFLTMILVFRGEINTIADSVYWRRENRSGKVSDSDN